MIICLIRGVNSLVEENLDELEGILIHVINATHIGNHEVNQGTTDGHSLVTQSGFVDTNLNDFGLSNTAVNFSGGDVGVLEGVNEGVLIENLLLS